MCCFIIYTSTYTPTYQFCWQICAKNFDRCSSHSLISNTERTHTPLLSYFITSIQFRQFLRRFNFCRAGIFCHPSSSKQFLLLFPVAAGSSKVNSILFGLFLSIAQLACCGYKCHINPLLAAAALVLENVELVHKAYGWQWTASSWRKNIWQQQRYWNTFIISDRPIKIMGTTNIATATFCLSFSACTMLGCLTSGPVPPIRATFRAVPVLLMCPCPPLLMQLPAAANSCFFFLSSNGPSCLVQFFVCGQTTIYRTLQQKIWLRYSSLDFKYESPRVILYGPRSWRTI